MRLHRLLACGLVLTAVHAACGGGETTEPGENPSCDELRSAASPGTTTIRILNGTAGEIRVNAPSSCCLGVKIDGLTIQAGGVTCDDTIDGKLEVGDGEPNPMHLAPGESFEFAWDRRTISYHEVPDGCDSPDDELDTENCSRADAAADGAHQAQVTLQRTFDGPEETREFSFELPSDVLELEVTDP